MRKSLFLAVCPLLFLAACSSVTNNVGGVPSSASAEAAVGGSLTETSPNAAVQPSPSSSALDAETIQETIESGLPAALAEQSGDLDSTYMVYCPDRIPMTTGATFFCEFDSDLLYGEVTVTIAENRDGFTWAVEEDAVSRFTGMSDDSIYQDYYGMTAAEILAILPEEFSIEWDMYPDSQKADLCLYYGQDAYSASDDYVDEFIENLPATVRPEQIPSRYEMKQIWEAFMEDTCYTYDY